MDYKIGKDELKCLNGGYMGLSKNTKYKIVGVTKKGYITIEYKQGIFTNRVIKISK